MKAIYQAVNDRSKIRASLFNIRERFKDIRSYEKMLSTPELAKDLNTNKTRLYINAMINECVNELAGIEPLVKIYWELFQPEFDEAKTALHRIVNRQKPVPCGNIS